MSSTWVTLIQKQCVLFNVTHHTHVRAIQACLHIGQKDYAYVPIQHLDCRCALCYCYTTATFSQKLQRDSSVDCLVLLCLCLFPTTFFSFKKACSPISIQKNKITAPNVSLKNESHTRVWFIADLTHALTSVGDTRAEGPAQGKFIKTLSTTEQKASVTNQRTTWACLFTVGLWKLLLSTPLHFSVCSPGGLGSEG